MDLGIFQFLNSSIPQFLNFSQIFFCTAFILPFLLPLLVAASIAVSGCRFARPNPRAV
jgi:hypothetical protein